MTRPVGALLCLLVFATLAGPLDWRNWLLGLPLAALLPWALVLPASEGWRLPGLPAYILSSAWKIVIGTLRMLRIMLRRDPWSRHGFVLRRPTRSSPEGFAVFALAETASPGTIVAGRDPETGDAIVHDIDASGQPAAPPAPQETAP